MSTDSALSPRGLPKCQLAQFQQTGISLTEGVSDRYQNLYKGQPATACYIAKALRSLPVHHGTAIDTEHIAINEQP